MAGRPALPGRPVSGAGSAEAALLRDSQAPISMSAFGGALQDAAWRTKPSWAVIATEDHAFDLAMLRHTVEQVDPPRRLRSGRQRHSRHLVCLAAARRHRGTVVRSCVSATKLVKPG